jgi:acetylornithine deacetylase/succinyl-diaminopimelate desuccinylase-like protein
MDIKVNKQFINEMWDTSIIPVLKEYIHIPNKSPLFDSNWQANGYMDKAVELIANWCEQQDINNMGLNIVRLPGRTPLIFLEIPGNSSDTILLYGHLDKQPEMTGWDADLAPWKAVHKGDKLYGRGGADDGYAAFASIAAIKSLQQQNISHARCIILIEACEESGSYDLPYYIEALKDRIGEPNLVICLDSGCGNYEQLWLTTSLRGMVGGNLHINVLSQGVHSGLASGIVPSCFMVLRQLLDRIEDKSNGEILLKDLTVNIPAERKHQAEQAAQILQDKVYSTFPFEQGVDPIAKNLSDLILNRTWRPALSLTGAEGIPLIANAGNVTLPYISFKLSLRIPPTCDKDKAGLALKEALEKDPPFNAKVQFDIEGSGPGWNAPIESHWLTKAANSASLTYFGKESVYMGEGGSIPFMGMLGEKFPRAQFLITGVLGPGSNAHGPNEFLHIPTAKKLTCCIAQIIADHYQQN